MMHELTLTRRQMLAGSTAAVSLGFFGDVSRLLADETRRFSIGVCDWSMGKAYDPAAFGLAEQMGIDGVQVSFGPDDVQYDLRRADVRAQVAAASKKHGVQICSLGMAALNNVPYADDENAERWVAEAIDVMTKLRPNPRIVLLAFFGKGDILDDRAKQKQVIRRLRQVAPAAEKSGVVLGVESWLDVDDHLRILDAVGSSAVSVYYDVANMTTKGYDVCQEIRTLGRERICQIHAKENGYLLGQGKVDFEKVKQALDDVGWTGWLVIEGATVKDRSRLECYQHNQRYLRSVFPT